MRFETPTATTDTSAVRLAGGRAPVLTVGIVTRNRPASLLRCVQSLGSIGDLVAEIIVVDDASDRPPDAVLRQLPPALAGKLRIVHQAGGQGPIVARNTIVRLAAHEWILSLDDDAYLIDAAGIERAIDLLAAHPTIGAIACAQAEADGSPWPATMQPARVDHPCYTTAYIGFAHFVRRSVFLRLGGYRERLHFYGEEKDFCLRMVDAGYDIVYLPDVRVAHVPDPSGRSLSRYLRYVVRNDCFSALHNEPLPLAMVTVPLRLMRYLTMRRHSGARDPGGLQWLLGELASELPVAARSRRPVRWRTIFAWRRLRRSPRFGGAVPAVLA